MKKRSYHESSKSYKARKKRERAKRALLRFARQMQKPAFLLKVMRRITDAIVHAKPLKMDGFRSPVATKMRGSAFEHCDWQSDPKYALWAPAHDGPITDPG